MNETEKLIAEQLKTLPPNLRQAIDAVPWKSVVQDIGKGNALNTEQITSLEQETMFIIYAFEPLEDYVANLVREVGISETLATTLANAVSEKIFQTIEDKAGGEEKGAVGEANLIESLHDENGAESIRQILKANSGEDREKLIENQFKKLPEALQEAIQIVPWRSVVKEIALLNKLDLSQIVAVERETMFVIYGFEDEKNYLANIMREAKLEEAVALSITAALNERVFKVIINKVGHAKPAPQNASAAVPKTQPDIHPVIEPAFAQGLVMVKKGEVAHEVPHVEQPTEIKEIRKETIPAKPRVAEPAPVITPTPKQPEEQPKKEVATPRASHYPDGKDPYREPLL